jgi:GT2 family glycosyltransferase
MVSIVLVNWRGWQDTILCLQSLLRLRGDDVRIVICDNASGDESVPMLRAWASGLVSAWVPPDHPARSHAVPGPERTMALVEQAPGDPIDMGAAARLVLLHTGANLGFAGGCNAGMRYAIARGDSAAVWLLNNDTVVQHGALDALLAEASRGGTPALVSSRVYRMLSPRTIWFEGGEFRPFTGAAHHVSVSRFGRGRHPYLSGCSLLIPRAVWERVGLLDESFFMYGEDVDYSIRATALGVPLRIATDSIVLHAEAASSGRASASAYRNIVSSGLRVGRRHFSAWYALPAVGYHVAKLAFLWAAKRRSSAALRGYWSGIVQGLRQ